MPKLDLTHPVYLNSTPGEEVVLMPAGEYWVGDPCYSVPDEDWMTWLEAADFRNGHRFLVAEVRGYWILGVGTHHGDGEFEDESGEKYPVDAGLIGLTPVAFAKAEPYGSHKLTFDKPIRCTYEDGWITLGDININTDWEE